MKVCLLALWTLLLGGQIQAEENKETAQEYTQRIYKELEEIKNLNPEDYFQKIDTYRGHLEKYIAHKKRVCEGEFSTIILEKGEKEEGTPLPTRRSTHQLTSEERKLCFRELKILQTTFINNMFVSRKKYLDHLHQNHLEQLTKARKEALQALNRSFSRKPKSKRRRKR